MIRIILTTVFVAVALAALSGWAAGLDAPFTRLKTGPWTELANSICVASCDYDNNGWPDLFVGHFDTPSALYRNQNGTFSKVTTPPVPTLLPNTHAAAWADYDNDGWPDLVVACLVDAPQKATVVFHGLGDGLFERLTNGPIATATGRAVAASWADYTGDGLLDLFIGRGALVRDVANSLYLNNGPAGFSLDNSIDFSPLRTDQGTWADYDGDGDLDLFVVHAHQQGNTLYRNDGHGHFQAMQNIGLDQMGESVGAAWGDFDNDGDLDLVVINFAFSGPSANFFYRNNGNGTFTRITDGPIATDTGSFQSSSWVDVDNDGWLDLFVTVEPPIPVPRVKNCLYHNLGDGTFEKMTNGTLVTDNAHFAGASWLDYDNDGFPDVFVACGSIYEAQSSALYHNNGNSNAWIKIRCVGALSNRSAIGATVRVKARLGGTDRWQMRQIVGTEGWLSFNNLDVLIGLGDATFVDTLRIEWPSGIVQELHNLPVRQTLVIVEKTTLAIVRSGDTGFEASITGPRQQRYSLEASTDLRGWSPIDLITITNVDRTASFQGTIGSETARYFRVMPQ
jgi:hypothetical protein